MIIFLQQLRYFSYFKDLAFLKFVNIVVTGKKARNFLRFDRSTNAIQNKNNFTHNVSIAHFETDVFVVRQCETTSLSDLPVSRVLDFF